MEICRVNLHSDLMREKTDQKKNSNSDTFHAASDALKILLWLGLI